MESSPALTRRESNVFLRMRMKITAISAAMAAVVLIVVFAAMAISDNNTKMAFVSEQLDSAVEGIAQTGSDHSGSSSGDMQGDEDQAGAGDKQQGTSSGSSLIPSIGLNSPYAQAYVPIIVYRIDYATSSLVALDEQMARLTDESKAEAGEAMVSAPYGYAKDDESTLYYLKKSTEIGDLVAFTDIAAVNYYLDSMIRTFMLVTVIVVLALGGVGWFASKAVVAPAQDAWRRQRRFIADASHELKTPISVIVANSSLILRSDGADEESKKWTKATLEEAQSMKSLVEDMLYLAANDVERGCGFEEVDLSREAVRAAMQFEARAFEKGCEVDTDGVNGDVSVEGELGGLRRLLGILIDNACKYADEGTTIEIRLFRESRHVILEVCDAGEIIPAGLEGDIFGRFVRADEARTGSNGYGLGLSMAADIVERHGGEILARTEDDGRTIFEVKLPAKAKGRK